MFEYSSYGFENDNCYKLVTISIYSDPIGAIIDIRNVNNIHTENRNELHRKENNIVSFIKPPTSYSLSYK